MAMLPPAPPCEFKFYVEIYTPLPELIERGPVLIMMREFVVKLAFAKLLFILLPP